jgi:hypothetical protein
VSITLTIIGLLIGGVLVGQDMIRSAETRAQISQFERYQTATNDFRGKFNALPGDMRPEIASQFGFWGAVYCPGNQSHRDGNGLIDGANSPYVLDEIVGETQLFWVDLSSPAGGTLIDQQFPNSGGAVIGCGANQALSTTVGTTYIGDFIPSAKIGHGNFIYVYETSGANWYGLSAVTSTSSGSSTMRSGATIPVIQAYNIDKKIDDGNPATGNVQAIYINGSNTVTSAAPSTTISGGTASSCYDTTTSTYSITFNSGSGGNCALSVKFQ